MPDWKSLIRSQIISLHLTPEAESDLTEELSQHMEDRYRELLQGGADEAEAYRQTAAELDDQDALRELSTGSDRMPRSETVQAGSARSGNWFIDAWKDLRFAGRTMRKNPFFVLAVVLMLGLGIGANTTVFTLINTLLLNPLPVPNSSELTSVTAAQLTRTATSAAPLPISYLNLKDYQARNKVFGSLAGYTTPRPVTLQTGDGSERMFVELVTGNYFPTLDLHAAKGRFFLPEEDSAPGAHAVAVLNYGTWQRGFGGAADVIGRTLRINRVPLTVVGVAPPEFIGVNAIFGPDLWIPASMAERLMPNEMSDMLTERSQAMFQAVGRVKPGVSREQAQANMETIAAALAQDYPAANEGRGAAVRPIRDVIFNSASSGTSNILFGGIMLLVVVGIVLLIACSNVANLLLARAAARQHEIAVRLAIGASRGRLIRQLLTESASLGLLSGVAGLVIGVGGVRVLWSALPPGANFISPKLDPSVFIFTLMVSLATGFAFGTVPALRASRVGVANALKEEGRGLGGTRERLSLANALLVGQVAFSFLLLMTAAMFLRSIGRAYEMDPGFQTRHLAVLMTNPGQAGYDKAQTKTFYKQVRDRLDGMAGVASISWASNLPLWGRLAHGVVVEGREQRSTADVITSILNTVDVRFFETAGIPIRNGRDFTEMDREGSTPVAIINQKMALDYWPNQSALGKRIKLPAETVMRQIVGIARTANYSTLAEPPQACIYIPLEQNYSDSMTLYVRTKGDPQQIMIAVQREVRATGPGIMANDIRTGRTIMDNGLFQAKIAVMLLSVFGILALGLASVGLYGIMAYSVHQRTREIGVRMALGASQGTVLRLILRRGLLLVAIGIVIGLGTAPITGKFVSRALFGISGTDPLSASGATVLLLAVAFVACFLPAFAASRVDPMAALREE
jgi:predicted permease